MFAANIFLSEFLLSVLADTQLQHDKTAGMHFFFFLQHCARDRNNNEPKVSKLLKSSVLVRSSAPGKKFYGARHVCMVDAMGKDSSAKKRMSDALSFRVQFNTNTLSFKHL